MHRFSIRYQRADEESDSDESFHCCGKPEDLLESPPTPPPQPKQHHAQSYREVFVPEDQDFYCYQSGLERQRQSERPVSTSEPPPPSASASGPRILGRTHSSESDKTMVESSSKAMMEEPLLVIKTGVTPSSPSRRMSQAPCRMSKVPSPKAKSRRASLNIFRASSLLRAPSQKTVADDSSPTKKSRPPRARFSVMQATRRFSKSLYDIKEVDKRATLQPQGSSNLKDISE
ncbi:hypothetical protein PGTUg99_014865 [Puccinia graminis f. sp. tritici]|uniref:Uncharacterized protein n=1 Tax=Puccinia graminis f. sp. tritici TaxID=56615 RepID=A0A5B0S3Z4_PUCGR|nr:hypothetical protein PGTUg99_014865 [Puccinia graminis f. sp. tritici]